MLNHWAGRQKRSARTRGGGGASAGSTRKMALTTVDGIECALEYTRSWSLPCRTSPGSRGGSKTPLQRLAMGTKKFGAGHGRGSRYFGPIDNTEADHLGGWKSRMVATSLLGTGALVDEVAVVRVPNGELVQMMPQGIALANGRDEEADWEGDSDTGYWVVFLMWRGPAAYGQVGFPDLGSWRSRSGDSEVVWFWNGLVPGPWRSRSGDSEPLKDVGMAKRVQVQPGQQLGHCTSSTLDSVDGLTATLPDFEVSQPH